MENELESITFGIASKEYILQQSVVHLTNTDKIGDGCVYDERMGPLDSRSCKTCGLSNVKCTGHFGHIVLKTPVINPIFASKLLLVLNSYCLKCVRLYVTATPKLKKNEIMLNAVANKSKSATCSECGTKQVEFVLDKNGVLKTSNDKYFWSVYGESCESGDKEGGDARLMAIVLEFCSKIKPQQYMALKMQTRPIDHLIQVLPVLPHNNRPFMVQFFSKCDDDLTTLYNEIIKYNRKNDHVKVAYSINVLFNNSSGAAKHPSSGRKIKGIFERMAGKEGLFRNNCMGKRCNQTARAVASPGPHLEAHQVGIPRMIANILTRRVAITGDNLAEYQALVDSGRVDIVRRVSASGEIDEYAVAKFVKRNQTRLHPGDYIMRQGTLPIAVETGREVLLEGDKIMRKIDSSNRTVVIDASPASRRRFTLEVGDVVSRFLMDGDTVLVNRQPSLHSGSMTAFDVVIHEGYTIQVPLCNTARKNMDFDGDEANVHSIQTFEAYEEMIQKAHAKRMIISPLTGRPWMTLVQDSVLGLYLMTLPHENIELPIPNGVVYSRPLTKRNCDSLVLECCKMYGEEVACEMISRLQHVSVAWLTRRGFSITGRDIIGLDRADVCEKLSSESSESGMRQIQNELYSRVVYSSFAPNLKMCVESGAKGSNINIGQMLACLGLQECKDGPVNLTIPGNLLPSSPFVTSSFVAGLTPEEYIIHANPSRDSIVDTATGTAYSGYMHHKLGKRHENMVLVGDEIVYQSGHSKSICFV